MKFGRFAQAARLMVGELLDTEDKQIDAGEIQTSLSVKVNVSTSAMLNVLSDHFGQSRYAFGGEILDDFTADFWAALPEELRTSIAEKADLLATEMLAKQGMIVQSDGVLGKIEGDTTWRMQNYALNYKEGV